MSVPRTPPRVSEILAGVPVTPPNRSTDATSRVELTPEQQRRIEVNRLKAKARQRELLARRSALEAESSNEVNSNGKRPLEVTPATSKSPTVPSTSKRAYDDGEKEGPLKRNSRLSNYFEYDLSKMVNTKGGFLVDEDGSGVGKEVDEDMRRREKQREMERVAKNAEPFRMLDPAENPKCRECGSLDIDHVFHRTFRCLVCNACKNTYPEKYSLLTKTECKEDYILTDSELRDEELLPHMLKPNPHSAAWNNMMLFLRYQVEEFAWKKWGSPEALDKEFYRREEEKRRKKSKKFERGLKELRRKTREGIWQKRKDEEHVHDFGPVLVDDDEDGEGEGLGKQRCKECGFEIEVEEF
ncbi:DNA repair protein rad14 {ECO:0000305} AltName: Full=XP-A family homolog rhp14 {ECO:0000303/PubMed:11408483} [Serendipita indica DSM 11827]|uniref:DNA repair protein RAD14 n=1 Tax=Serendipita indica (strain DSM 11827) TaxID=1109443 RepID=G4TKQ0_SERID|nr:DNA repair protein rad14 {ECO:0000305} AltName: Full=XP-A family homolog rhp14 {ECO:0000303/PubMed:11408483} [Serendipita indica DSM 11827]CCA71893.1 related to DNA repair protein RAD14 [Serendipita indica DSM 11827]